MPAYDTATMISYGRGAPPSKKVGCTKDLLDGHAHPDIPTGSGFVKAISNDQFLKALNGIKPRLDPNQKDAFMSKHACEWHHYETLKGTQKWTMRAPRLRVSGAQRICSTGTRTRISPPGLGMPKPCLTSSS